MSYLYAAPIPGAGKIFPDFSDTELGKTYYNDFTTTVTKEASDMEKEALAMLDCAKALSKLSDNSRKNVLKWLKKQIENEE